MNDHYDVASDSYTHAEIFCGSSSQISYSLMFELYFFPVFATFSCTRFPLLTDAVKLVAELLIYEPI